jgi:hypothetical protein
VAFTVTSAPGCQVDEQLVGELRHVEVLRELRIAVWHSGAGIRDLPADGRLAGAGAGRVGQRDVVVEGDPELDHCKQEQREDRQCEREFGDRLALL